MPKKGKKLEKIVDLRSTEARFRAGRIAQTPREKEGLERLRARRARVRAIAALLGLAAIAAIVFEVHLLSHSPRFTVQVVTVRGAQYASKDAIIASVREELKDMSSHYFSRSFIFTYPRDAVVARILTEHPRIKAAALARVSLFSNELQVTVEERVPFALWCADPLSPCFVMDSEGFIFTDASSTPFAPLQSRYLFSGSISTSTTPIGQSFIPAHLQSIVALADLLGKAYYPVERMVIDSDTDYTVITEGGLRFKLSYGSQPQRVVDNLKLVLDSEELRGRQLDLEYIDLRFDTRVYYKMKGEKGSESGE